jgi:hypothetical protein
MSPPLLASSTREPNSHTDVPWPNAVVAAWQMAWIWSVLRRMRLMYARPATLNQAPPPRGETYQEAIQNLKEATSLYLDEFPMKIHSHPVMTTFEVSHA